MKLIKKYTAIQLETTEVDHELKVDLTYGSMEMNWGGYDHPDEIHDTEEEAIEYAYKTGKYAKWLILPVVSFDTWRD